MIPAASIYKKSRAGLMTGALYSALFIIFLWPLLTLHTSFIKADYFNQHLPWAFEFFRWVHGTGDIFWTHGMGGGFPLAAEGQAGVFYPLHHLLYRVLPFMAAYTWSTPLHVAIGGAGMYLYVRRAGLSREAAGLAAVLFSFASGYGGSFFSAGGLRAMAWLPWILAVCERIRCCSLGKRLGGWGILTLLIMLMWTAGAGQIAIYAVIFLLCHEAAAEIARPSGGILRRVSSVAMAVARVLPPVALGTLIAAPQLVLTGELVTQSLRAGESVAFALWGSAPPFFPAALVFPEWTILFRLSWYLGVLPLFLLLIPELGARRMLMRRHLLLAVLFACLALGKYNPLYRALIESFSLTMVRNPSKFLFFSLFSLSVLAARGWDALPEAAIAGKRVVARCRRRILIFVAGIAVLPGFAMTMIHLFLPHYERFQRGMIDRLIVEKGASAKPAADYAERMNAVWELLKAAVEYRSAGSLIVVGLSVASGVLLLLRIGGKISRRIFVIAAAVLLFTDLMLFCPLWGTGFVGNAAPIAQLEASKPLQAMLRHPRELGGRWAEFTPKAAAGLLPPNSSLFYGVPTVEAYSPLLLKAYYDLTYDLGFSDGSLGRPGSSRDVWSDQRGIVDLVGTRWIRSAGPLDLEGFVLRERSDPDYFYENVQVLPDAAVYSDWKVIADPAERLAYLKSSSFKPERQVVLSVQAPAGFEPRAEQAQPARITAVGGGRIVVEATAPAGGVLWVRNSAYPGWFATVNGRSAPTITVQHAFLGVMLEPGVHRVTLEYRPTGLTRGVWGLAGAALLAAFLLVIRPVVLKKMSRIAQKGCSHGR